MGATDRLGSVEFRAALVVDFERRFEREQLKGGPLMSLLVAYLVCLVIGQTITIMIGLAIDRMYSPGVSLPISLALYFAMFWVAWKVAVRITEPKSEAQSSAAPPPG